MKFVPVRAKDLPLVRAAGGVIKRVPGPPGKRYYTAALVQGAVEVCRQLSYRSHQSARRILQALRRAGMVDAIGKFYRTSEIDPMEVTGAIARILGSTVVMGPIRAHPDGAFDICYGDDHWERATMELLFALDAERRLGAKQTRAHLAAEIILYWQQKQQDGEKHDEKKSET